LAAANKDFHIALFIKTFSQPGRFLFVHELVFVLLYLNMNKRQKDTPVSNTRKKQVNTARNSLKEIHKNKQSQANAPKSKPRKSKSTTNTIDNYPDAPRKPFIEVLKSKESRVGFGLFLVLFSVFLLFSFFSYLNHWKQDDNVVQVGLGMLFDSDAVVENTMGKFGAWFGYLLIKKWFGLASFLITIFIGNGGLLLLNVKAIRFWDSVLFLLGTTLWLSVFLSAIFPHSGSVIWGGLFGWQMRDWISSVIGNFGLIVVLLVAFIAYASSLTGIKLYELKLRKTNDVDADESSTNDPNYVKSESAGTDDEDHDDSIISVYQKDEKSTTDDPELIIDPTQKQQSFEIIEKEPVHIEPVQITESPEIELPINDIIKAQQEEQEQKTGDGIAFVIETAPDPVHGNNTDENIPEHLGLDTLYDPTKDLSMYEFPPTTLLIDRGSGDSKVGREELEHNKNRIVETLSNYDIKISQIKATIGPTVTMYEIVPAPGVRISRIKNLEDDIALSLAALGIRIIAPIPGKGTIGIEVPNIQRETVSLRSLLESEKFTASKAELPFAMGKTITNEAFVADLAKLPHLLIAGATGQGKSVGLNAIICSLLYKKHPSQLKFVFVDPKKVELALYAKIDKHFLAKLPDSEEAIITDVTKVIATLTSLTQLMDSRYDLLKNAGCKNIIEYNNKFLERRLNPNDGHQYMPYIVLVIDEFADLIMTAGKEVELPVARIAQLARAVGIHLIVATQRPSVDVITGKIKANFPARIAFKVSSKVDSRTILDMNGADQLIGMGDMLYCHGSTNLRLQCAFVDTPEIDALVDYIGAQQGYPHVYELPDPILEKDGATKDTDLKNIDKLFADAARIVVTLQQGSTSLLQTKLTIGFARARRIIDQLEGAGIVGPPQGSKPRDVLIKDPENLEQFLKNLD